MTARGLVEAVILVAGGAAVVLVANRCTPSSSAGGAHLTPSDEAFVAAEVGEQTACVEAYKPDAAAIDACRSKVRARFDGYWASYFDGGREAAMP